MSINELRIIADHLADDDVEYAAHLALHTEEEEF